MNIKLGFDPATIEDLDLCYIFRFKGVPLKIWCIYKQNHITNQFFVPAIRRLVEMFEESNEVELYSNIDEFSDILSGCGFYSSSIQIRGEWIVKHWDYFNLNINKQINITFEREELVTKSWPISA